MSVPRGTLGMFHVKHSGCSTWNIPHWGYVVFAAIALSLSCGFAFREALTFGENAMTNPRYRTITSQAMYFHAVAAVDNYLSQNARDRANELVRLFQDSRYPDWIVTVGGVSPVSFYFAQNDLSSAEIFYCRMKSRVYAMFRYGYLYEEHRAEIDSIIDLVGSRYWTEYLRQIDEFFWDETPPSDQALSDGLRDAPGVLVMSDPSSRVTRVAQDDQSAHPQPLKVSPMDRKVVVGEGGQPSRLDRERAEDSVFRLFPEDHTSF